MPQFSTCHKYGVKCTEPTPKIYGYAQRNKLTFLNGQYYIQSNKNKVPVSETQCIIYRPDLHNSQASKKTFKKWLIVKIKLSIKVRSKHQKETPSQNIIKGNVQFIFLCNPPKSLVKVCLMKLLKSTVHKKSNCVFF